ncbi:MAG: ACP S-malonyltransferase [Bacteroidales bacterium]
MNNKTAFIFPAFITSFTHKEIGILEKNNLHLSQYINRASSILNIDLPDFDYHSGFYQNDEFLSQIIAYTFSCAFNDLFTRKEIHADYIAGYSMGLYASLYGSKSIGFDDGLRIISEVYHLADEVRATGKYGMGSVVGLPFIDIQEFINKFSLNIEIINVNNDRSIVVSGIKEDIRKLLDLAQQEGAFSVSELIVQTPYHSSYLKIIKDCFYHFICDIEFKAAETPLLSTFDQRDIIQPLEIRKELVLNLTEKINWHKTMQKLLEKKVSVFYECGAGKDLTKMARFIEGDYEMKSVYKI